MIHRASGSETDMPESAVSHHARAGWELAELPAEPLAAPSVGPAFADPEPASEPEAEPVETEEENT